MTDFTSSQIDEFSILTIFIKCFKLSLCQISIPPESWPYFILEIFNEGTIISLYPIGQCRASLLRHHVSWKIQMSISVTLLSKSWSADLLPKVEECRPCIFQQLILKDFMNRFVCKVCVYMYICVSYIMSLEQTVFSRLLIWSSSAAAGFCGHRTAAA